MMDIVGVGKRPTCQDVDKLPHSSAPPNKLLTSIASFDKCWKTIGIPSKQWLPNPKVYQQTIKLNSCSQPFQKMAMFAFVLSKIGSGRKPCKSN